MNNIQCHTVGTDPQLDRTFIERGQIDTSNTHLHGRLDFLVLHRHFNKNGGFNLLYFKHHMEST